MFVKQINSTDNMLKAVGLCWGAWGRLTGRVAQGGVLCRAQRSG